MGTHASCLRPDGSDDAALAELLRGVVRDFFGSRAALTKVGLARCRFATSYDTYIVTVRLATGGELRFFLKDFGVSRLVKNSRKDRRERELRLYRDLLPEAGLGTARYFGSVWDESGGRYWLLLEFVPGKPLRKQRMEHWLAVAAWAARFHRHFLDQDLGTRDFLIRHDSAFFLSGAEGALREVSHVARAHVNRLDAILRHYDRVVDRLTRHRTTLIHGSFWSYNILVEAFTDLPRVCPIDWEGTAYGAPLYDLAHLVDGFDSSRTNEILAAYRLAAVSEGFSMPEKRDLRWELDCFRLHMVIDALSRARVKEYTAERVERDLGLAEELQAGIGW